MEKQESFWKLPVQIAVGLALAGLVSFVVRMWLVQAAMQNLNQVAQASMQQIAHDAQVRSDQLRLEQLQKTQDQQRQRNLEIQAANEAALRESDYNNRKQAAWAAYFHPEARCENPHQLRHQHRVREPVHEGKAGI